MSRYLIAFALGIVAIGIPLSWATPHDDTYPVREWWGRPRSGLGLYTDARTGCQYVKAGMFGGITPRLNGDGKPMCGATTR